MGVALDEARATLAHDDVPVGAVIVRRTTARCSRDATTNASSRAIPPRTPSSSRSSTRPRTRDGWRLDDSALVVTLEAVPDVRGRRALRRASRWSSSAPPTRRPARSGASTTSAPTLVCTTASTSSTASAPTNRRPCSRSSSRVVGERRVRLLALGGIVGPLTFVGCWAIAAAVKPGDSAIDDAISDLAAVGATTRLAMTVGFVVFGVGLGRVRARRCVAYLRAAHGSRRSRPACARSRLPRRRSAAGRATRCTRPSPGWATRRSSLLPALAAPVRGGATLVGHVLPGSLRRGRELPRRQHVRPGARRVERSS